MSEIICSDESPALLTNFMVEEALEIQSDFEDEYKDHIKNTSTLLRLEHARILKIDNLTNLRSLTKLYLDNNLIEEISGLECLVHLVWLDLSFNKLVEIQGLENLIQLEVLALNNNGIEKIQGMDSLEKLKILRIGSNNIEDINDILYLRKMIHLRTISVRSNPFCNTYKEWKSYIIALLPQICFLECSAISQSERRSAITLHQGAALRTEAKEDKLATELAESRERASNLRSDRSAFVEVFKNVGLRFYVTQEENETFEDLENDRNLRSLVDKFKTDLDHVGKQIYDLGHEEHKRRSREISELEDCLASANEEYRASSIRIVEEFLLMRGKDQAEYLSLINDSSNHARAEEEEDRALRREFEKLKKTLITNTDTFKERALSLEYSLVNQTNKTIAFFEENLLKMVDDFMSKVGLLFSEARSADTRFYRRATDLAEIEIPEKLSNTIRERIGRTHDKRQQRLSSLEYELEDTVRSHYRKYAEDLYALLQKKHRTRILELHHFLNQCNIENEEYDFTSTDAIEEDDAF